MHETEVRDSKSFRQDQYDGLTQPIPISAQAWPEDAAPLVSICCLTYNHGPFIRECLDGFLMQETTFPVEILIHDDASTDDTAAVIREYAERHTSLFKPILQTENQYSRGISPLPHFLLPIARGKYIATCEGDDYWTDPLKLEKQVEFLESHPDYVLCYHDVRITDESGRNDLQATLPSSLKRDYSGVELTKGAWALTQARCYRNVIKDFPPEFGKVVNRDIFLSIMLGQHGNGKYLADIQPSVYRKNPGGVFGLLDSKQKVEKILDSYIYIYQYLLREVGRDLALEFFRDVILPHTEKVYEADHPQLKRMVALRSELADVHASASYRLGRAMTSPVRLLAAMVRRWRGLPKNGR